MPSGPPGDASLRSLSHAQAAPRKPQARFVYMLRSLRDRTRDYTGVTGNVAQRLAVHNSGGSKYKSDLRPWRLIVSLEFATESSTARFEQYLKSGSANIREEAFHLERGRRFKDGTSRHLRD
jgi:predicted GIY-YIG superfamily endonuclease